MSNEVVLVMGYPAAGKTELVQPFVEQGYKRLNRDTLGGSTDDLLPKLNGYLLAGDSCVLDNLYPTVESRKKVLDIANKHQVPVRCIWIDISIEDAMVNACLRMLKDTGRILQPTEKTNNPNHFPVAVLYSYRKNLEKPTITEGFNLIDRRKFKRRPWPAEFCNKALILDYDQTLRDTAPGSPQKYPTKPEEVVILPGRSEVLKKYKKDGYLLLGASNQSGIAKKSVSEEDVIECFQHTNKLLGVDIDFRYDPSKVPPITSYCRKPNPGLLLQLIWDYKLDPAKCIFVGDQTTDKNCAKKVGMPYQDAEKFFAQ